VPFPLNESQLSVTESKLGVKFPVSFRQRMMESNGGELETGDDAWELYPFHDTSDKKRMTRTFNDIIKETDSAKGWDSFPKGAIAIGSNGCGDQLVLLPDTNNPQVLQSAVYFWNHETGDVVKLANDFAELG
jgi:hypothetical protein